MENRKKVEERVRERRGERMRKRQKQRRRRSPRLNASGGQGRRGSESNSGA